MSKEISLHKSKRIKLPTLNIEAQTELLKGWSFSYVYFFKELRDIFLLLKKHGYGNLSRVTSKCKEDNLQSEAKIEWTERNVLERINALKNFGLISREGEIINQDLFNTQLGSELSMEDKLVFKQIFFSYFRFKEIISWMINPYSEDRIEIISNISEEFVNINSRVIFPFISEGRFVNSFFFELKNNADVFFIDEKNSDLMRFWDVFIKWGITLEVLDRFQLKLADIYLTPTNNNISCVYFKNNSTDHFSLLDFINQNYKSNYIYIPQLMLDIVINHRFSLEKIKEIIVNQSQENKSLLSMQRTSEIFIDGKEKLLLPMHRNAYISHLLRL